MDVFSYGNCTEFLLKTVNAKDSPWGSQSRLAEAAGCQRSYFSQVLKGRATLTQDQAMGIAGYLNLSVDETSYFLLLTSLERASTEKLKSFYRNQIKKTVREKEDLSKRYRTDALSDVDKQAVYYSTWLMSAVHILIGIDQFQTLEAVTNRVEVSKDLALKTLKDLEGLGLAEEFKKGHWRNIKRSIHLPKESPMTSSNHNNWRQKAILDAALSRPNSLHYTAVMSISKRDITKLKALALSCLDETRNVVRESGKEDVVCLCLDLFEV